MFWKVVKLAWKLGWLDTRGIPIARLKEFVDIQIDFPSVATRDRTALVNQLVQEVEVLGVTSRRTAAIDLGRDYDEELRNGAKPEVPEQSVNGHQMQLPNAQDGTEQNRQPPQSGGELSNASTLQFNRTTKAIGKILDGYKTGQSTRNHAKQLLLAVGMPDERAEAFLSDADENKQNVSESFNPSEQREADGKWTGGGTTDNAVVNVPLDKRGSGSLNSQIDKWKKDTAAADKKKRSRDFEDTKTAKAEAKRLYAMHGDDVVNSFVAKRPEHKKADVAKMVKDMVTWQPQKAIALFNKYVSEKSSSAVESVIESFVSESIETKPDAVDWDAIAAEEGWEGYP
jgi:hypothetical protein